MYVSRFLRFYVTGCQNLRQQQWRTMLLLIAMVIYRAIPCLELDRQVNNGGELDTNSASICDRYFDGEVT